MSKYTNYEEKPSTQYDLYRLPVGLELYNGLIRRHVKKDLGDIHLLDLGCGTGNYSKPLLDEGIGKMTCVDASQAMLDQCKMKIIGTEHEKKVDFKQVILPNVPYPEEKFDVIINSYVLHHLVNPEFNESNQQYRVTDWSNIENSIINATKSLKKNGLFLILYSTDAQAAGLWYGYFMPKARSRSVSTCPTPELIGRAAERAGLKKLTEYGMLESHLGDDNKNNEEFFLNNDEAWMQDSITSCGDEEELERGKEMVRQLKKEGKLSEFMKSHDGNTDIGFGRIIAFRKV